MAHTLSTTIPYAVGLGKGLIPSAAGALYRLLGTPGLSAQQLYATKAPAGSKAKSSTKASGKAKDAAPAAHAAGASADAADDADAGGKPKRAKRAKDAPPRALSAYTMFVKATSSRWFTKGAAATDAIRAASAAWKGMGDAERAPYVAMALEAAEAARAARGAAKAARAPPSAYAAFVSEQMPALRAARPGEPAPALMRAAAAAWREVPESEKLQRKLASDRARAEWAASKGAAAS